jgi:hypothetical protein
VVAVQGDFVVLVCIERMFQYVSTGYSVLRPGRSWNRVPPWNHVGTSVDQKIYQTWFIFLTIILEKIKHGFRLKIGKISLSKPHSMHPRSCNFRTLRRSQGLVGGCNRILFVHRRVGRCILCICLGGILILNSRLCGSEHGAGHGLSF